MKQRFKQWNNNDLYYFFFPVVMILGKKLQSIYFLTAGEQRTAGFIELTAVNSKMERSTQDYSSPICISSHFST